MSRREPKTIEVPAISMRELVEQRMLVLQHRVLTGEITPLLETVERDQEREAIPQAVNHEEPTVRLQVRR